MTFKTDQDKDIIEYLLYAERDAHEVIKITDEFPELTIEKAYELQDGLLERRLKEKNKKTVGNNLETASEAKQVKMGVEEAIDGYLHEDMLAYEWEPSDRSALIHPKIETEIAFVIDEDIEVEDITEKD